MKQILLYLLLFSIAETKAQKKVPFIDSILNNRTIKIPVYKLAVAGNESKVLIMEFAKNEFVDTAGISVLNNAEILSIDLVFTDYPAKLDLKPLNKKRFMALSKLLPNAMTNPYTQWQMIRQMNGYSKETANGMLHGFVINYRKKTTGAETRKEIALIKSVTPEEIIIEPEIEKQPSKKKANHWEVIHRNGRSKYLFYNDRQIKSIGADKKIVGKEIEKRDSLFSISVKDAFQSRLLTEGDKSNYKGKDSVYILLYPKKETDSFLLKRAYKTKVVHQRDSTVLTILKRNKFRNMLMVVDVTGSMSSYTSQVIQWISEEGNQQNLKSMVCFNDGDGKQTEVKQIGNTGGIYGEAYQDPIQISELIQTTMNRGSGGDLGENVCEAILKAIALFREYDDVVLIADSWAPARDITLAAQIKKPVKIVVCGDYAPHEDYVEIAYKTGGSLHLTNEDITDFSMLKSGKQLIIRGKNYIFQNGRVVAYLK